MAGTARMGSRLDCAPVQRAREQPTCQLVRGFPAMNNGVSNAACRKADFELLGQVDFECPQRHTVRCNDWPLDLFGVRG
jgi:hypothetical protein